MRPDREPRTLSGRIRSSRPEGNRNESDGGQPATYGRDGRARGRSVPMRHRPRSGRDADRRYLVDSDGFAGAEDVLPPTPPAAGGTAGERESLRCCMTSSWRACWRRADSAFGRQSKMFARRHSRVSLRCRAARAPAGSTSPPSARPLVSRITCPTIGPIAFALPPARARRRRGWPRARPRRSRRARRRRRSPPRPSASTIAAGSPPSATSLSSTWRAAPTLTRLLADQPDERAPAPPARRCESAGSCAVRSRAASSPAIQLASAWRAARARRRRERRLEVVAELGAEGEQLGAVGAQPELALEALGARRPAARASPRARPAIICSSIATGTRSGSGK